jgi:dnd system-associated protein 4
MNNPMTIEAAAVEAIKSIGRPASIDEILAYITSEGLFAFNTPKPGHVLRTTIRRSTDNVERIDSKTDIHFTMTGPEIYGLSTGKKFNPKVTVTPKRIHRAKDKQEIIETLTSDSLGVFKEIWRLQLFAAQVGLTHSKRVPLEAVDSGKGIDQSTFGNCSAWPGILYLIAITEANSADPLSSTQDAEDLRISAFEEYSNGGLEMLRDHFKLRQADLNGLLEFIETNLAEKVSVPALDLAI